MKTIIQASIVGVALLALTVSCRKNRKPAMSEEDAVEVISNSVGSSDNGVSSEAIDAIAFKTNPNANTCGFIDTVIITRSNATTATRHYNYTVNSIREVVCQNNQPFEFKITSSFSGNYVGPKLESSGSGTYNGSLSEINSSATEYHYVGSTSRTGNGTVKTKRGGEVDSELSLSSDVYIDKTSEMITRGTTTFSLTGNGSKGRDFEYTGTVTYNGNKNVTIVINGNTHNITYN